MSVRRSKWWLLLPLGLLVGGALFWFAGRELDHPTDPALLENFAAREKDFDRLLEMIRTDAKLNRVDNDWTDPEYPSTVGVSPKRVKAYRDLFKELKIPRGVEAFHRPEEFTFIASAKGLAVTGSSKGYVYRVKPPEPDELTADLDLYRKGRFKSFTAYRYIKGNWYLYFDYED